MPQKTLIACDHSSLALKTRLIRHMEHRGYEVEDLGTDHESSVDYPDYAEIACKKYLSGEYAFGILLCGTGIGISIAANKIRGIRCALPQNAFAAQKTKEHNNANFIAFGGGNIDYPEPVETILDAYIDAEFKGGRHLRRIEKIIKLEQSQ